MLQQGQNTRANAMLLPDCLRFPAVSRRAQGVIDKGGRMHKIFTATFVLIFLVVLSPMQSDRSKAQNGYRRNRTC